jgi:hypothetical protein
MKCPRCGKDNPPSIHTCTAPPAIYLAEQIEAVYEAPHLPRKAAAELRRLHEANAALRAAIQAALSETGDSGWELYFQNEIIRNRLKAALARAGEKT